MAGRWSCPEGDDRGATARADASGLRVSGDASAALHALADRLEGKLNLPQSYRDEIKQLKADVHTDYKKTLGPYADFAEQLRAAMPDDAMFVRDVTKSHTTWGYRLFPILSPETNIYPVGAAIGPGFQLGMGAALGSGRKTVAMTGDGGFFLNLGETCSFLLLVCSVAAIRGMRVQDQGACQ